MDPAVRIKSLRQGDQGYLEDYVTDFIVLVHLTKMEVIPRMIS